MKVTHCLVYYSGSYKGGIQRYVDNVFKEQNKKLDANIFTTTSFSNGLSKDNIYRVKSFSTFLRTPISPIYPLELKKINSDILHFHSPNPLIDFSALISNRKYVVNVHNIFPEETVYNYLFIKLAKKLLIKNLDKASKIVVYNKNLLNTLIKNKTILEQILEKTVEILPGIDKNKFKDLKLARNNDVIFVAHIRPEKGLHVLIDSFSYIEPKDSRLVILAKITYFQNYFAKLISKARKLLGNRLIVIKNPLDEQIVNAYNKCGCVVCPSLGLESWNFVLMEAASCGAAIVRSDLEGMNWIREPCCAIAKVNDPKDLAEKINLALSKKEQLGKKAKKEVDKYSWGNTANKLIRIYNEVLKA